MSPPVWIPPGAPTRPATTAGSTARWWTPCTWPTARWTALAEWYRHLAEAGMPPHVSLPRDLWGYDVASLVVADLSDPDRLAGVGLPPPRPGGRSWPAFQAVGEQLQRQGWRGLLAPSAARPASHVLVVFLPETRIPVELVAAGYTRVAEPPAPPTGMRT
ncbi:MAG: RES domain-containing protein [Acidimicrobiales bacterium]